MGFFGLTFMGWTASIAVVLVLMFIVGPVLLLLSFFCCPKLCIFCLAAVVRIGAGIVRLIRFISSICVLPFITITLNSIIRKMDQPQEYHVIPDVPVDPDGESLYPQFKEFCESRGFTFAGFFRDRSKNCYASWSDPERSMGALFIWFPNGTENVCFETSFANKILLSTSSLASLTLPMPENFFVQTFPNTLQLTLANLLAGHSDESEEKNSSDMLLVDLDNKRNSEWEIPPMSPESPEDDLENDENDGEDDDEDDADYRMGTIQQLWEVHQKSHQYLVETGGAVFRPWETWQLESGWQSDGTGRNAKESIQQAYENKEHKLLLEAMFRAMDLVTPQIKKNVCAKPFWYLRCGWWALFRDARYANKTIQQQYESGLIKKLPKDFMKF
ncbi:MAG: hypothetical protein Q4G68_04090 [Planctomycetia bacterium]|nr:hypothetical protein [Planctomycetia bacterium]